MVSVCVNIDRTKAAQSKTRWENGFKQGGYIHAMNAADVLCKTYVSLYILALLFCTSVK
jgi:hypothetical protein